MKGIFMNKKFISGTIFGLCLGVGIGVATPIIGATSNKPKDIVINKNSKSFRANTPASQAVDIKPAEGNDIKEAVTILKEISASMKENSATNKEILAGIRLLSTQLDVNPVTGEKKK
jgi:hypothetical protein